MTTEELKDLEVRVSHKFHRLTDKLIARNYSKIFHPMLKAKQDALFNTLSEIQAELERREAEKQEYYNSEKYTYDKLSC